MATLIVKLTATGGRNTADNPANAQDSDDNRAYCEPVTRALLHRSTGDHNTVNLGTITKVELVVEGSDNVGVLQGWQVGWDIHYTPGVFDLPVSEAVQYIDVTLARNWAWSDFSTDPLLSAIIEVPSSGDVYIDQLAFRITYTLPLAGWDGKINGVESPNIRDVNEVNKPDIAKVNEVS